MPYPRAKPVAASDSSASDEASKLELYLQRQLEEDVARIFDESIYSDLEVVCGKLKILTHSCILKARTTTFYSKLEAILHVNIEREIFDEIYSFISDAYTECDIKNQENEILIFLQNKIFTKSSVSENKKIKEEIDDINVFLTPNCTSPYIDNKYQQISCLSPSTELTKEYYALVHIDGNLLEQELIEQDALSNAFHTLIKSQDKIIQRNKPTSLSLTSSHSSKTIKHSNNCDIYNKVFNKEDTWKDSEKKSNNNQSTKTCQSNKGDENNLNKGFANGILSDKILESTYSPDSLITDDPSSSSDYLSAAYTCSPALGSSGCLPQLNVGENSIKMENIFTSSDSGLENTGMLESLSNHKEVTDTSLTEISYNLTSEETFHLQETTSSPEANCYQSKIMRIPTSNSGTSSLNDITEAGSFNNQRNISLVKQNDVSQRKSSKEEKQRQNEEIVILESSSVSSETGSWESVFPPRITDKEICDKFIHNERQYINQGEVLLIKPTSSDHQNLKKLLIKHPAPCFIDAANLVDEEQISADLDNTIEKGNIKAESGLKPTPSKPVPCTTVNKPDISPSDWSESNDNDDSLEQGDNKDTDSIQKDLSSTIFEMTPITEDSLNTNIIEASNNLVASHFLSSCENVKTASLASSTDYMDTTPHNSIMSLKTSLKQYESEESENDSIIVRDGCSNFKSSNYIESTLMVPGSTLVNDADSSKLEVPNSPLIQRQTEKTSLVKRTPYSNEENNSLSRTLKPVYVSAWVVDMSINLKENESEKSAPSFINKKPGDMICEGLRTEAKMNTIDNCKSRSSVDSDSSEKSGHKFFIDLSTLPDPLPPEKPETSENNNEKKNMFSMYIDIGETSTLKEMPTRLSSSINNKKQITENKCNSKHKTLKPVCSEKNVSSCSKSYGQNEFFERYESLCEDSNISISEIIAIPETVIRSNSREIFEIESDKIESPSLRRLNGDKPIISNTVNVIHEESNEQTTDIFVKLSDLDKPIQKTDMFERDRFDSRMTRSIPDNNWLGQNVPSTSSKSSEVISSFHSENALSLNRLFPHLKNEFSKSMPISLSGRTRSPLRTAAASSFGEIDEQVSDVSEISSIQSSACRSVIENSNTEETSQTSSLIGNCQSRLGQDLLRMFLEEIAPDVIVEVAGKRIKAHKCILSSRCQYFAGILSGGWVESAGNAISLPPFSFNVVHFALCHIYSGLSTIPDSISIVELATIADMLGLEGLKEAIMFTLKVKYCHHFHRPCQVCTVGVLECFPLSSLYGLDDLHRKCLRWITKYFSKIWPTKAFATLPKSLLDKCYQEHIVNLTVENLIETIYGCGITVASLQNSRWAESVAHMCRRLINAAAHFAAPRLVSVLEAISVAPEAPLVATQALDDCLSAAIEWAPPDETCRAYAFLSNLIKDIRNQHSSKSDLITNGNQMPKSPEPNLFFTQASSWRLQCEGALVRAAPRVVGTQAFKELPPDLRRRLRELGCIMYGPQAISLTTSSFQDRKTKSAYHNRPSNPANPTTTRSLDMEKVRNSFVPYTPKPIKLMGSKDKISSNSELRDIKKTNKVSVPKVRTTKAQEERAKFNQTKSVITQDRPVTNKPVPARPHPFENTKPRYLEPRLVKEKEKKSTPKKFVNKVISSSESSRNSSPIQNRNLRSGRIIGNNKCDQQGHAKSQDSLITPSRPRTAEPSTDSLSESQNSNKYATYTKVKHTSKGSVESVMSRCQGLSPSSLLSSNIRTKIPVYHNQGLPSANGANSQAPHTSARFEHGNNNQTNAKGKTKSCERKISGSLMNATKSSSAKIVPKVMKETMCHSQSHKPCKQSKTPTKHTNRREDNERAQNIPVMERSGTFLKDRPTFGNKNPDIDKTP